MHASTQYQNNRPQQNTQSMNYAQNNHAPQNNQQGGNQVSQPIDKACIKVVRKYVEKKVNGQTVFINVNGIQTPQMTPLYKIIGEVTRWPAQTATGYFDKVEMYPGNTILESLTEGVIDWQSQNTNQSGRV